MATTTTIRSHRHADSLRPDVRGAAAYGRLSDEDLDKREGVDDQLDRAQAAIERRGWQHVGSYRDDGISAYGGKPRPGFDAMMAAVAAGYVNTIVVRHIDRLWRNDLEAAQGRQLLRQHRVLVAEYNGMDYAMWTAHGQHMARTMGGNATFESDVKGERVREAAERRARDGRMNGPCPYGWRREYERTPSGRVLRSYEVVHAEEAEVVREITRRLLAGDSLLAVTNDLNARKVPPPGTEFTFRHKQRGIDNADGSRWAKTSVKKLALRASNAGLRIYHQGQPDERRITGTWPALVSVSDWEAVVDLLTRPGRDQRRTRPAARQHLLTWGVGVCGVCGGPLRVARKGAVGYQHHPVYVCGERNSMGRDGKPTSCVGRRQQWVDELVRAVVIDRLSRPDAADLLGDDGTALAEAEARVASLRDGLQAAADRAIAGRWTFDQVDRYNEAKLPELADAEAEVRQLRRAAEPSMVAGWIGPAAEVADRWDGASVQVRRALLEALGMKVILLPLAPGRRGSGFDPDSLRIEYER